MIPAHSKDAKAALQTQPDAPSDDQQDDSDSYPAPSPLHVACRGLPLDIDILKFLLNANGTEGDWDAHVAALSSDGSNKDRDLQSTFSTDTIGGQQPLHTVALWPHLRISPKGTRALFLACPAVAKMLVRNESNSSPLHQSCGMLEYTRTVLESNEMATLADRTKRKFVTTDEAMGQRILEQIGDQAEKNPEKLRQTFATIDADNSKEMDRKEWREFIDATDCTIKDDTTWRKPNQQEIFAAWNLVDINNDGTVTYEEFVKAVETRKTEQRKAAAKTTKIHLAYLQERERDMMEVAMAMVHQLRGIWTPSQNDALDRAGIMATFSHWIQDLWQPVRKSDALSVGTFVSVNHTKGMKARVMFDYRPDEQKVELEEYTVGANIHHADFTAAREIVNTEHDLLLRCPLCEFLCDSNNPFEFMFNLIDFFKSQRRRNKQDAHLSRKEYQNNALSLMDQVARLASWMPLRCIDGDQRSYNLSKVLLQPAMLPTCVSAHHYTKGQLSGGIGCGNDLLSDGPLTLAVRHDVTLFTSSDWVKSYVDRSQFDGIHRGDHLTKKDENLYKSSTFKTMARKMFWEDAKSLYHGWHIPLVQQLIHDKLTRSGVVDVQDSVALLGCAVCGIVNPRGTFKAPRMLWWLNLLFQVIFVFCFTWLWTVDKGENRPSRHREISCQEKQTLWFGTTQLFESSAGASCWTLKRSPLQDYTIWDWYILLTAIGMAIEFFLGRAKRNEIWNQLDFFSSMLILGGSGLMMFDVTAEIGYNVLCVVALFLWLHMLEYLQDSSSVGPMVKVVGEMALLTVQFFMLIIIIMMGFACSMTALLQTPYEKENPRGTPGPYTTIMSGAWTLFRALLGDIDGLEFKGENREYMAAAVMAIYLVVMSIIMINMLIAVLSSAHAKVAESLEEEVAHVQTRVAINSQHRSNSACLPAPMNLFQMVASADGDMAIRKALWDVVIVLVGVPLMVLIASILWLVLGPYIATMHLLAQHDTARVEVAEDLGGSDQNTALNILAFWLFGTCPLIVSCAIAKRSQPAARRGSLFSLLYVCFLGLLDNELRDCVDARDGRCACGPTAFLSLPASCYGKRRRV
eukprot:COSAG02_NODE_1680_length_11353_cov_12.755909_1_plen_1083_part_00